MPIEPIVDTIIDVIQKNIIAKTNVVSDVVTGDIIVNVENSFHLNAEQEIVLIDYGYNNETDPHYGIFEYAKIKEVNNTHSITLETPVVGNWTVAKQSFVQKTIGHSPLYDNHVYYGDREVIPTDLMAVTIEGERVSNDWMYLQGGLNEEYRLKITVYGKSINVEDGRRILDRYSDNIVQLLNNNIHIGIATYSTKLLSDVAVGDTSIVIEDTPDNRKNIVMFTLTPPMLLNMNAAYAIQDNLGPSWWFNITNISISGGLIHLTIDRPMERRFTLSEFVALKKFKYYLYDSRAEGATYGYISKGSTLLRASEISWFGKMINEFRFPQSALNLDGFSEVQEESSSSE